jgi:hypothetical protein
VLTARSSGKQDELYSVTLYHAAAHCGCSHHKSSADDSSSRCMLCSTTSLPHVQSIQQSNYDYTASTCCWLHAGCDGRRTCPKGSCRCSAASNLQRIFLAPSLCRHSMHKKEQQADAARELQLLCTLRACHCCHINCTLNRTQYAQ